MDNLRAKSVKAFLWNFYGRIASFGMGLITSIFLARLLEPSDFGLIAMVMVVVGMASVFTDVGLGGALIQRRKIRPIHYSSVFYFNIFVGMLLTFTVYFAAPWISEFYQYEQLISLVHVMSFSFIISAFSSVQTNRLIKELNHSLLTKIRIFSSLVSGIIGIFLAFMGAGVWSLVAQVLINGIIYNILIWSWAKWVPGFIFSWKALNQLWGFGFRMFLVGLLDAVYIRMDYLIIGKLFDSTTLGFFQKAKTLNMMAIEFSSGSLMSILFPVLSIVQNNLERFQKIILKALGIISFVVFLLFGYLYLTSEELIVILFSEKWLPSAEYFKILALSGFAYPINALLVNILSSRGNSKAFLRMAIYKKSIGFLNLSVGFLYGIEGYLYGLIVVAIIQTGITINMASRESHILAFNLYKPIFVQAIITIVAFLITLLDMEYFHLSNIISIIMKVALFSLCYLLLSWAFKTSSFIYFLEEIKQVYNKRTLKGA